MNDRLLPPGLIIEQEITPPNDAKFGIRRFIVCDERWDPTHAPRRHVRVFPDLGRTNWGSKLQERLERLFERPLPHVSRPLEIAKTVDGQGTYVVTDWYECTLAMRIAERGLVDDPNRALAWKLFEQLAEGLDALHGAGLPHGALCPACVGVDLTHKTAWIGGAPWGPLRHWTSGDHVASEAIPYQAPECRGPSQAPSEKADLYALGQIGFAMLCGFIPTSDCDQVGVRTTKARRRAAIDPIRRRLLAELIANESTDRPPSAEDVVRQVRDAKYERKRKTQRTIIIVIATCAVVTLACLGGYVAQITADRNLALAQAANAIAQANALGNANLNLQQQNNKVAAEKGKLEVENKDLRTKLAGPTKIVGHKPPPPPSAQEVERKASDVWNQYARNPDLTFDRMGSAIEHDDSISLPQARQKALAWHADFAKSSGRLWRLHVVNRSNCGEGSLCIRDVDLIVGDKRIEVPFGDDQKTGTADFNWSVGEPIKIELYDRGESKGWWPFTGPTSKWVPIGTKPFDGPVGLWLLKRRKVYADDGNAWVDVEIEGCPGPQADERPEPDPQHIKRINSQRPEGK